MNPIQALKEELAGLVTFLFPPACPLCGMASEEGSLSFCRECRSGFSPVLSPHCPLCVLPFHGPPGSDHYCEGCLNDPPPFDAVTTLGLYQGTLAEAVRRFKYRDGFHLGRPLGLLLAQCVEERSLSIPFDLIVPVPLHRDRLRERTYNQALLLAQFIGERLEVPAANLLRRTRATPSQQGLSAQERLRNLKGVFELGGEVKGKRILLVDDVMTTGATARECGKVLLRGGAAGLEVAVAARAARHF